MRFVFLNNQSGDNVESGLEDKETEGRKTDIIIPLGMERKRWIRKTIWGRWSREFSGSIFKSLTFSTGQTLNKWI